MTVCLRRTRCWTSWCGRFFAQRLRSPQHVLAVSGWQPEALRAVLPLLRSLRVRLREQGSAVVLPGGGGRGAKLARKHLPFLPMLEGMTAQAIALGVALAARRAATAAASGDGKVSAGMPACLPLPYQLMEEEEEEDSAIVMLGDESNDVDDDDAVAAAAAAAVVG
eukprot:PLAT15552.8.p4 GENE.PLAT15552.8~~PLAT15552.8.p4  ORF type:complete len:166 (+),score=93.09 PLAT15552.8:618-1115(+)